MRPDGGPCTDGFCKSSAVSSAAQGIVGEGYTRVLNGEAHTLPNDGSFHGDPTAYLLPYYFPFDSAATHKSLQPAVGAYRRLLAPV